MPMRVLLLMYLLVVILLLSPAVLQAQTAADADFDGNGVVEFADFLQFARAYNTNQAKYDLNKNGRVDFSDFLAFAKVYGQKTVTTPPSGDPTITVRLSGGAIIEMVHIEPGTFMMGSSQAEIDSLNAAFASSLYSDEDPQHEVTITKGFYLGKYEVTQGQWQAAMGTTPWSRREYVQANPDHPAVYVMWEDAQAFIQKVNQAVGSELYRLPTEAEWEYACRAGTGTRWSFGDDESQLKDYAWYAENAWNAGEQYAHKIGKKQPNPWGLYDMHGNVSEWCQDWYWLYPREAQVDPAGPPSSFSSGRIIRGGGFGSSALSARSAIRGSGSPFAHDSSVGFRLVRRADSRTSDPTYIHSIAGRITESGAGLQGVSVELSSDFTATATTDSAGNYSFSVLSDGFYTLKPYKRDFAFSPDSLIVTVSGSGVIAQDFIATENLPFTIVLSGNINMEFVYIEPGKFVMGGWDAHDVTISQGFYLGRYEVTQLQWEAVMGTRPWMDSPVQEGPEYPAVNVSWNDAQEFVHSLNAAAGDSLYRLSTEAEWEYACSAGTRTSWSFGDDERRLKDYAWYRDNALYAEEPYGHEVGTKKPNPWGLYDMYGNVSEWCQDWYLQVYYAMSPIVDPQGPETGSDRVLRGGSISDSGFLTTSFNRNHGPPSSRWLDVGFRLVRRFGSMRE